MPNSPSTQTPAHANRSVFGWLFSDDSQLVVAVACGVTLLLGYPLWEWGEDWHNLADPAGHTLVFLALALGLIHGMRAAITSLFEFRPDIDVLMVVGALLSAIIGHPEEGALLLFMFTLAQALEHRAMNRAKDAVSRLNKLMPKNALVKRSEEWVAVEPESLHARDVVLVRPGETIPADGCILKGHSEVDQSSLTGESLPRSVEEDDDVYAGTLNGNGVLEIEVTRPVQESSIQRILELVLEAQERRQPVQRVIDRFSTPYTIGVFVVATLAFLGFWSFAAEHSITDAAIRAITLLVVASPCALVISTPTATLCGLSRAARSGVLVKGGDALERLSNVRHVVLDKTGTLTTGQIDVTQVEPIADADERLLLSLAYAAEATSTHPLAMAIVRYAESHNVPRIEPTKLKNVPGRGVEGEYEGKRLRVGSLEFCEDVIDDSCRDSTREVVQRVSETGSKAIVVAYAGRSLVLRVQDTPRADAAAVVQHLRETGIRSITMLTGDSKIIANQLAQTIGITDVHAELMPEDKVNEIRQIRAEHSEEGGLAVIGDGVNDAPALAEADVGLAMGGIGADAALEAADVVLLHDDLDRIPWSIALAKRVKRVMIANLTFATLVIVVLALLTVFLNLKLSFGVVGHEGSTLLVVANSLRLLAHRGP